MDTVYVVSIRARADRQAFMRGQLAPLEPVFSFDVDADYDGRQGVGDWGEFEVFPWQIASANEWWNRPLRAGEIGCFLAHVGVWRDAARRAVQQILVLEDDAVLTADGMAAASRAIAELRALEPRWDLLYLGRRAMGPDRGKFGRFSVPGHSWLSHAYALSAPGIAKLLAYQPRRSVLPLDDFLSASFAPHPRDDVAARIQPTLNAFSLDPPLVGQAPEVFFGSDIETSPFIAP